MKKKTLLFNFSLVTVLGKSKRIRRDWNWMEHISSWSMARECHKTRVFCWGPLQGGWSRNKRREIYAMFVLSL